VLETISALLVVLGAMLLVPGALRAVGLARLRGPARSLRVLESCSLGTRQRLHVVECEGERMLVGATDQHVSLLRRLPARPPAAAEATPAPRARRRLFELVRALGAGAGLLAALAVLGTAGSAHAEPAGAAEALLGSFGQAGQPDRISSTLQIVLLLTAISVAPSILLMATCFTRIVIVLSLLRQAVGIHQLPPNQVIVGLSLFTTLFVMAPVGHAIQEQAIDPYRRLEIDAGVALERAAVPVRAFLAEHTREDDLALFVELADEPAPASLETIPLATLLPAFVISELRTAFEIGFMIYLPFLVIDLVISSMLISMGMIVLPPVVISLPFKLMLFVLIDGWNLVVTSLVAGLR
jgi:flagellar biosynthetic protein FliP